MMISRELKEYNPEGSDLRNAQIRMLDIFILVDSICQKHNIRYWISSGTLLGSVRHQGFIPWDDDLDIMVYFPDYQKLLKLLEIELPDFLIVHTRKTDRGYHYQYAKVRDLRSFFDEPDTENLKYRGLSIDIFPMEHMNQNLKLWFEKYITPILVYRRKEPTSLLLILKNTFVYFAKKNAILLRFLIRLTMLVFKPQTLTFGLGINFLKFHQLTNIFPLEKILFEGHLFNCPRNVDLFLTTTFGNYFELPPKEQRIWHSKRIEIFNTKS
jgi:lipopolysaccharide cholinephosphotransferase